MHPVYRRCRCHCGILKMPLSSLLVPALMPSCNTEKGVTFCGQIIRSIIKNLATKENKFNEKIRSEKNKQNP